MFAAVTATVTIPVLSGLAWLSSSALLPLLDERGVYTRAGSAASSDEDEPSTAVLLASLAASVLLIMMLAGTAAAGAALAFSDFSSYSLRQSLCQLLRTAN